MGNNSFGKLISITTFGESHGKAIGVTIDGLRPNFSLDLDKIQLELDRRRPGGNKFGTKRNEKDKLKVISGMYKGKVTGTPLTIIIENTNQISKDYSELEKSFRPSHADYTYYNKYNIRDPRGGGRSSGRETATRVIAGAVCKQYLDLENIKIEAATIQIGNIKANNLDKSYNWEERNNNDAHFPDSQKATEIETLFSKLREEGDSIGGIIECHISNVPVGLGEPTFDKFEARLASAMLSLGAARGFELGEGFSSAEYKGSEFNDKMNKLGFISNHNGGTLGGITNSQDIIFRVAFKPTPSISIPQETVDINNNEKLLEIKGRHDPCICPRAVVVVEAMAALVTLDFMMEKECRRPF
ncbi:MAG: chorismate synthase [Pleomorphochaeta sp.]